MYLFRGKYRHYDYGYGTRSNGLEGGSAGGRGGAGAAPVAQKKHQMFGKRVFQDQSDMPGSPAVTSIGSPAKFDYGSGASASGGSLYSQPSTPLDVTSGMSPMEMKYGCGMEYTPHAQGTLLWIFTSFLFLHDRWRGLFSSHHLHQSCQLDYILCCNILYTTIHLFCLFFVLFFTQMCEAWTTSIIITLIPWDRKPAGRRKDPSVETSIEVIVFARWTCPCFK